DASVLGQTTLIFHTLVVVGERLFMFGLRAQRLIGIGIRHLAQSEMDS
ncbi:unnamed protein product, partial [marine sediment metagenome]